MSLETCNEHDDTIVVYERSRYNRTPCPLCQALDNVEKQEKTITDLESQVAALVSQVDALISQIDDLNETS